MDAAARPEQGRGIHGAGRERAQQGRAHAVRPRPGGVDHGAASDAALAALQSVARQHLDPILGRARPDGLRVGPDLGAVSGCVARDRHREGRVVHHRVRVQAGPGEPLRPELRLEPQGLGASNHRVWGEPGTPREQVVRRQAETQLRKATRQAEKVQSDFQKTVEEQSSRAQEFVNSLI